MELKTAQRAESLDALRGLAILMMVLSGAIPFGDSLPAWMYHAQVPPPNHVFHPEIPGITWVDLVFPFFIFSMGAAIPFAVFSRMKRGENSIKIFRHTAFRWAGLSFFAFAVNYIRPWVITQTGALKWIVCLLGFVFLFASFVKLPPNLWNRKVEKIINVSGFVLLVSLILILNSTGIITLSLQDFDIIIMILACISLFGGIIQLIAKGSAVILTGFLVFITSFYIAANLTDSWVTTIWNYSPFSWLISWEYIKYLMILIPGIWAGNVLKDFYNTPSSIVYNEDKKHLSTLLSLILLTVNIVIVVCLYLRIQMPLFIFTTIAFIASCYIINRWDSNIKPLIIRLFTGASFFIFSGLIVEPLQGGIKKDPATLGYLTLTSGMALLMLIFFIIAVDLKKNQKSFYLLTGSGKNAMLAYFTGGNLIVPVLALTGVDALFGMFSDQPLWQTVKGILITVLVAWSSAVAAKKRFMLKA